MTNVKPYRLLGPISKLFEKVKELCVRLVVYCHRHSQQSAYKFVLREPKHDRQKSGRPAKSKNLSFLVTFSAFSSV